MISINCMAAQGWYSSQGHEARMDEAAMLHGEFTFVVLANISLANELQIMVEA
jgi:hypothetical protein